LWLSGDRVKFNSVVSPNDDGPVMNDRRWSGAIWRSGGGLEPSLLGILVPGQDEKSIRQCGRQPADRV